MTSRAKLLNGLNFARKITKTTVRPRLEVCRAWAGELWGWNELCRRQAFEILLAQGETERGEIQGTGG